MNLIIHILHQILREALSKYELVVYNPHEVPQEQNLLNHQLGIQIIPRQLVRSMESACGYYRSSYTLIFYYAKVDLAVELDHILLHLSEIGTPPLCARVPDFMALYHTTTEIAPTLVGNTPFYRFTSYVDVATRTISSGDI